MIDLDRLSTQLERARLQRVRGRLLNAVGPMLEAELPGAIIGGLCEIEPDCLCEVIGFRGRRALLMPLQPTDGIKFGGDVWWREDNISVAVGDQLIGRIVDGLGNPIDNGPALDIRTRRPVFADAPDPLQRALIQEPLETGVRVIDGMLTIGQGQRISIMAGSGVGKSTLMGMLARNVRADLNVICLLGERGREVREFIEDSLGEAGLARTVMVVITSDKSPALQVKGAFLATTIAEHFRNRGKNVLLMMDSITRLALAQRQIGLAAGEPPTTRGFTPSVFGLLPKLLERAGPGANGGSITGIYTVLVEGDDIHDPIGDAVRGIVDGHIVLSRKLASHGHYPAVDVLASLSRLMNRVCAPVHLKGAARFRDILATWEENEELIRLGAYRKGTAAHVDEAVERYPHLKEFLSQPVETSTDFTQCVQWIQKLVQIS